jgi:hypothetical protein
MGQLAEWRKQQWVRIGTDGSIKGPCGTSKDKKNPDRCLPRAKAQSLSKSERASTAKKKKREGSKGKTVVANTPKAKVRKLSVGGYVARMNKGCGAVMDDRRKRTKYL